MRKTLLLFCCFGTLLTASGQQGNHSLTGIYIPTDSAYRRECAGKIDCQYVGRPFILYDDGVVVAIPQIGFTSVKQIEDQLTRNHKYYFEKQRSTGTYTVHQDTLTMYINYPFYGRGQTTKYVPAVLQGIIVNKDTVRDFKMIPPYPSIFEDNFYQQMNSNFKYVTAAQTLLYKSPINNNTRQPAGAGK